MSKSTSLFLCWCTLACIVTLGFSNASCASLMIYESFDYGAGNLAGNNGGLGWNTPWAMIDPDGVASVTPDGLTFSDMPVSGRAAQVQQTATGAFFDVVTTREVGVSIPAGEDLWISFLYRQPDAPLASNNSRTAELRHEGLKLRTQVKAANTQGIAFRYGSSGGTATNATQNVQTGETFLIVARYGDVGQATGDPGTMWVLSESDYESVKLAGVSQAALDANNLVSLTSPHANVNLNLGDDVLLLVADSQNANFRAQFDELRYGTSIEDVVLFVPEPASAFVWAIGFASLLAARRVRAGI